MTNDDVLDTTERLHDGIDLIRDRGLARRAEYGGEAHFHCQRLRKRGLTDDQEAEVRAVMRRIYVECLGVPEGQIDALLTRLR